MMRKIDILYIVTIVILLSFVTCGRLKNSELKKENLISINNSNILKDSLIKYKTKSQSLINEKGVLISDMNTLKSINNDLYKDIKKLQKNIPHKVKPIVAVSVESKISNKLDSTKTTLSVLNDSSYTIEFKKDTSFGNNNARRLYGNLSVNIYNDNTNIPRLNVGKVYIEKDEIDLSASLLLGLKDGELKVWLTSDYPGFDASKIDAVTLDPDIHPELKKLNNKRHSIGFSAILGFTPEMKVVPVVGFGYHFSIKKF